jgi:hypothetical protein
MESSSSDLIVLPERRKAERLLQNEGNSNDRRVLPRYILAPNNPFGFSGLDDPGLKQLSSAICLFQNEMIRKRFDHSADMAPLSQQRTERVILEGGAHVFSYENKYSGCFLVELLGSYQKHLVLKGGYLAVESPRDVMEFADTLFLQPYQGAWVIMRTWDGLVGYLNRILRNRHSFGPWLEYRYDEFHHKFPELWSLYTNNGLKKDNGNLFLVRTPIGFMLEPQSFPDHFPKIEDQQARSASELSYRSIAYLIRYYAQIERAGRLGSYKVPDVRNFQYGDRL